MAHLVLSEIPPEGLDLSFEGNSWLRLNGRDVSVACVELLAVAEVGTRHYYMSGCYVYVRIA